MQDIINLLPDSIANQIAAGEVVQRPASVVKELMENAVDAGANVIILVVKDAGKALIQVTDNGNGMSETDARMCFERHATSKIRSADDLFAIRTMGFRGEALASIAAVAQVELQTRRPEDEIGTLIQIENSRVKKQENTACAHGTGVSVKNLFFNIPARRNFLKSNPVEMRHIMEEFTRVALAYPQITFSMFQNDMETFKLKPGKLSRRIVELFGKSYREQLIPCEESLEDITLTGYIGKPESAKRSRGDQFFYVNNRFIKSPYLNHAVNSAFEGLIEEGQYPFHVLFIDIGPMHIDVNVHPTKTEIKFDDERTIYTLVKTTVRKTLGSHNITPSLDFSVDTNFGNPSGGSFQNFSGNRSGTGLQTPFSEREKGNLKNWEAMFEAALKTETPVATISLEEQNEISGQTITFNSAVNDLRGNTSNLDSVIDQPGFFQMHNSYFITQVKSGFMLIDQQRAHERILYEKYHEQLDNNTGVAQQNLFPERVKLNPSDMTLVKEIEQELKSLGFDFENFGDDEVIIQGVPPDISAQSSGSVFTGLIDEYKRNYLDYKEQHTENLARAMAKNSCIKTGKRLAPEEMKSLIDQLFACKNPNYNMDGQLIYYIFGLEKIADLFNKK